MTTARACRRPYATHVDGSVCYETTDYDADGMPTGDITLRVGTQTVTRRQIAKMRGWTRIPLSQYVFEILEDL